MKMKEVGYSIYAHVTQVTALMEKIGIGSDDVIHIRKCILETNRLNIKWNIIKFDRRTKNVSFIDCPTFDILNEPIIENSYCFHKVYHHKWMFVSDEYTGFNVKKAKKRSELIESIPNIKSLKSKIGNKDYWYALLKEYGIPI